MLKINKINVNSKKIKQCVLASAGVLPKHPFRCYIVGASGSGKTNLLLNLLTRENFYRNYFDRVFIVSPTALSLDESYKTLEKNTKYKQGEDLLFLPCEVDALQAVLDDVVSFKKFTNSNELLQFSIMSRHYQISMFILSQAFHLIPKSVRLNMSAVIYFKGSAVETETLVEQYCPAGYRKKEFQKLVEDSTDAPYSFLFIDLNTPLVGKTPRYRHNLTGDLLGSRSRGSKGKRR